MAKGKRDKPTRRERKAQKKQVVFGDDTRNLDTQLQTLGLTTKCITGDGNCLFRALSDQYYGYDKHHGKIRQEICHYLKQHKDTYQYFVEDDVTFDRYISNMEKDGTFGGHMVLVGFAKSRQVDIKIYQPGMIYVISGIDEEEGCATDTEDEGRQVMHIAYHSWEHYSSVRNINGPYSGMPEITDQPLDALDDKSNIGDQEQNDDDDNDNIPDSKEKVILTACPDVNIRKIRRLLRKFKGDPDKVIDVLYEEATTDDNTPAITNKSTSIAATSNTESQLEFDEQTETATSLHSETDTDSKVIDSIETAPKVTTNEQTSQKRLTAREKKHQTKLRQKERQREKKQMAAARHTVSTKEATDQKGNDVDQLSMKQLYI